MACLLALEALEAQYEESATFPTKYDPTARFKGRDFERLPS